MKRYKKLILEIGYVVDGDDEAMVERAKICFIEDIQALDKYDELFDKIDLVDAPDSHRSDIPEFLIN